MSYLHTKPVGRRQTKISLAMALKLSGDDSRKILSKYAKRVNSRLKQPTPSKEGAPVLLLQTIGRSTSLNRALNRSLLDIGSPRRSPDSASPAARAA